MAASRRLQLAAEARGGFALLARPPREESVLSAAATRFRVRRGGVPVDLAEGPGWSLEVLRCKSVLGFGREQQVEDAGERGLRRRESVGAVPVLDPGRFPGGSRDEVCVESSP